MGWSEYPNLWRPLISIKNVELKEDVLYFIQPLGVEKTFLISRVLDKQNEIIEYKFTIVNNGGFEISISKNIESNTDLMKLIIDFEACNEKYKRHFKLNRILK
jgi:hypothetical protein